MSCASSGASGRFWAARRPCRLLYDQLARVSPTSATVLLIGESGTGKELCAQTIHEMSRRKRHPFLPINCGAVSPQLIESELFGHEKGSFTGADRQHKGFFERANGGTIFLDEITEMPADLQVKLLRVLETGTFVRVGNTDADRHRRAHHRGHQPQAREGGGRGQAARGPVPPPERVSDPHAAAARPRHRHRAARSILPRRATTASEGTNKTFSREALAQLYPHTWPGNVRELKNYVQRAYIMADDVIEPDMATAELRRSPTTPTC